MEKESKDVMLAMMDEKIKIRQQIKLLEKKICKIELDISDLMWREKRKEGKAL